MSRMTKEEFDDHLELTYGDYWPTTPLVMEFDEESDMAVNKLFVLLSKLLGNGKLFSE
jgi:hypothetical protein